MPLRREQHGQVGVIVIERPDRANAIDLETAEALAATFDELEQDAQTKVVVLTGAGERVFCAGMDLAAVKAGQGPAINGVAGGFAGIVRREMPKPVIAAVNGLALGGGFEIALACDLVVAVQTASFGLPEVTLGLFAASGGIVRLPRRVPAAVALEMILTGARIDAVRARELGLVNMLTPAGEALAGAIGLAQQIAAHDAAATSAALRLARSVSRTAEEDAWRLNDELAALVNPSSAAADSGEVA